MDEPLVSTIPAIVIKVSNYGPLPSRFGLYGSLCFEQRKPAPGALAQGETRGLQRGRRSA